MPPANDKRRLAVFVSGQGSNFRAIQEAIQAGSIPAEVGLVVTHDPACAAAGYGRELGLEVVRYPAPGAEPADLVSALASARIDFALLAGYLKRVPSEVVRAYRRRMLNIHPALLPSYGGAGFYGRRVHEAVLASGDASSGPTVHFVDEEYDHGPILAQATVPVLASDTPETLAARVLQQEHQLYPAAVAALCRGEVNWSAEGQPRLKMAGSLQIAHD